MPSRRAVLAGTAGIAAAGIGVASQVRVRPIESWTPTVDTWPLRRYGPAGTAANLGASPPPEPSVEWSTTPLEAAGDLVVGPETVYASGSGVPGGIAAIDRASGTVRWQVDVPGGPLGVYDGTVFVPPSHNAPFTSASALRAFDTGGAELWKRELRPGVVSLVVADGTLFVGGERSVRAYGTARGRLRWAKRTGRENQLLVTDGHLYAAADSVRRYHKRTRLATVSRSAPGPVWSRYVPAGTAVAFGATAGHLVAGSHGLTDAGPTLASLDPDGGVVQWGAFEGHAPGLPERVAPLAIGDERCYVGLRSRSDSTDGSTRSAVAGRNLADGTREWRQPVRGTVTDVALVDGTVLVATAASEPRVTPGGSVRALRDRDGSERWRMAFDRRLNPGERTTLSFDFGRGCFSLLRWE